MMEMSTVKLDVPEGVNLILGQSHFIKTVEDIYEALISSSPDIRFGVGFCESSGPALVRFDGNDDELSRLASAYAFKISAGHSFVVTLRNAFPINVLNTIKRVVEVVTIFCATANPIEVILVETELGRGILGVIDGVRCKGIEEEEDKKERHRFLRKIGYKR